ncbi:MAG TPA: TonB family protein [Chitinophagaceae bacterium]|jgi:protein TonB|nr:TonB family protein [Chitinophagaceae bacterium]
MTNKEILHADLLDILFENRNKAYGAYALRKNYNHRLQWALGISLSLVLFLSFAFSTKQKAYGRPVFNERELTVVTDDPEKIKPKEPETTKPKEQPRMAEIKSTDQIKIVNDNEKTDVPDQDDINKAIVSNQTIDGLPSDGTAQISNNATNDNENNKPPIETIVEKKPSYDAHFPGGKEAFANFLQKYLTTPGDLEPEEKKTVLVRFMVDSDGSISETKIVQSGGDIYDREVIRVLRKMPKWIPAMQNGINVTTWFTQPVTFIGIEQ